MRFMHTDLARQIQTTLRRSLRTLLCAVAPGIHAQTIDSGLVPSVERQIGGISLKPVTWRCDIHSHAELPNQEVRTAKLMADHPNALGLTLQTFVVSAAAGFSSSQHVDLSAH